MERLEMIEKLRQHADISYEEAKQILDETNDDMLEAVVLLEKQGKLKKQQAADTAAAAQSAEASAQSAEAPAQTAETAAQAAAPAQAAGTDTQTAAAQQAASTAQQAADAAQRAADSAQRAADSAQQAADTAQKKAAPKAEKKRERGAFSKAIRAIGAFLSRTSFHVEQGESGLFVMPSWVFAILMFCFWKVLVPVMIIALFFGIRYHFSGAADVSAANEVLAQAGSFADGVEDAMKREQ